MKTMMFILTFATLTGFVGQAAMADLACIEQIDQKKLISDQTEQNFQQGTATRLDVLDAKLAVTEQIRVCKLISKSRYCYYTQTLMNTKIRLFDEGNMDSTQLKKDLQDRITYCIDANAGI